MLRSEKTGRDFVGPFKWASIHATAAAYTPDKCDKFKAWIRLEFELFPCAECSSHALRMLQDIPPDAYLGNNHDLFFWTYLLHDTVNKRLGKKSPRYDDIKAYYFAAMKSECKVCQSI